jgi:hypothetical protein
MVPMIYSRNQRISLREIREIENTIGHALPPQYTDFLLKNNGGAPIPNCVRTDSFPGSSITSIEEFFGINSWLNAHDILWNYRLWIEDSPKKLLPIADDVSGSVFVLSLSGDDYNHVYYWDYYKQRCKVRTRYPWTYPVSSSFQEFCESFEEYDTLKGSNF